MKGKQEIQQQAGKRFMYLQRQGGEPDRDAFLKCDEMTDLYSFIKRSFSWKEGTYTLTFEVISPDPFHISGHVYEFNLSSVDIEELEKNKDNVEQSYRDLIPRQDGYDLRVMSVDAVGDLEDEGRDLVIVALVGTNLHIRIFDASGGKVVDKVESELVGGETLTALKQRLVSLPDESGLSQQDKQEIIGSATSIAGHTRQDGRPKFVWAWRYPELRPVAT